MSPLRIGGFTAWTRTVVAAAAVSSSLAVAAPAAASPQVGDPVLMSVQCRNQYPAADGFGDGQAYLVAPRDAFSWRCERVSASGTVIADLPVDPNAYCFPYRAQPAPNGSQNWECTA